MARIISYILAIALLITSINIPSIQLNAEESVSKEESSVVDTPDATPEDSLEPTPSPHETKTPTNEETNKDEESADEEDDAEGATPAPEATPGQSRKALSFLFTAPAAQPYDEGETVIMCEAVRQIREKYATIARNEGITIGDAKRVLEYYKDGTISKERALLDTGLSEEQFDAFAGSGEYPFPQA